MMNEDGSVIITINGEIYNYFELKKELLKKYHFTSTSDSEVILYGYIEVGIDKLLEKIDGMSAFSIYNKTNSLIVLILMVAAILLVVKQKVYFRK